MSSRVGLLRSVLEILYKVMEGCDRQQIVVEWHYSRFQTVKTFPFGSRQGETAFKCNSKMGPTNNAPNKKH
ncbi:hypothetical protein T09_5555 [Trichinella sp. T9]|nr:hypothetical protein T09_5555 [Trichinella sp. T9]KRZ85262.1 hypothetical protein T08_6511 [Trichinella sp. T8]KRZ85272.1 hypothetical protein T08_2448 [Trichinella sp. T8]